MEMEDQLQALIDFFNNEEGNPEDGLKQQNNQLRNWINDLLKRIQYLESKIGDEVEIKIQLKYQKAMLSSSSSRNKIMKFLQSMDFSDGSMTVHLLDMLSKISEEEKNLQLISLEMSNFNFKYDEEMYKISQETDAVEEVEEEIRNKLKGIELRAKFDQFDLNPVFLASNFWKKYTF